MDKIAFLAALDAERAKWDAGLAGLDETQMLEPTGVADWSVKDLVAHVVWFERQMVRLLQRRTLNGESPLWEKTPEERNKLIYEENRERPLELVLTEARAIYSQMREQLGDLTDEELTDPRRFNMPEDWVPWQIIAENTYQHYQDHRPALKRKIPKR
jgi:uncharacterized protein (TIGR03083 family)